MTATVHCGPPDSIFPCPPAFGADELGRAAGICYSQRQMSTMVTVPPPRIPQFRKGWEACVKVYAAWLESEAAKAIRAREAEEDRQREFINDFVKRMRE